jgi:NAD(P)-dependent dehydrogenase (short-subunit alcohol dehydrogenase family)
MIKLSSNIKINRMPKVIVTGANKGIGFAISKELGLNGWHVLVGARNKERGEKAVKDLKVTRCQGS